ncbi:MAG: glucosaminidase domain-containing protein [Pseudomonadales bacterium]|nr:glucosaminidase domain-containing protein [Pseudomonadales bacterium]
MSRFDQIIIAIISISLVSGFIITNRLTDTQKPADPASGTEYPASAGSKAATGDSSITKAKKSQTDKKTAKSIPVNKKRFFEKLLPLIEDENNQIAMQRKNLLRMQDTLLANKPLSGAEQRQLAALSKTYRVSRPDTANPSNSEANLTTIAKLLKKVDQIPASLVLSQSANESAWGRSRFAKEANNYFGIWCFKPGCGVVPTGRPENAKYEVTRYRSTKDSVHAYFVNINSHPAYKELRRIRAELRAKNAPLTGTALAMGLSKYSSRGAAYIKELQAMIRYNKLEGIRSKTL